MKYDIIIIGSGPGGYVAAIRAAQLGRKVAIVEKAELGGVCLNWGCIPTKAMLKSAQVYNYLKTAANYGIEVGEPPKADMERIVARSRSVAEQMSKGVSFLLSKNKVDVLCGTGLLEGEGKVKVLSVEKQNEENSVQETIYEADHIILATGARPRELPNIPVDGKHVVNSRQALCLDHVPESLIVVGSGAIGSEFAYLYASLGSKVTIVEYLPNLMPLEDEEVSKQMERTFRKMRIGVMTGASVRSVKVEKERCKVEIDSKKGLEMLEAEMVLSAVGIKTNIEGLGLEKLGVTIARDKIVTDEFGRTNIAGIYAIGDLVASPALAHVASAEGIRCVEKICGLDPQLVDHTNIPSCIYTSPEVASVGLTEKQALEQGYEIKVGKFPYTASGKATAAGDRDGFVKLIFDCATDRLLGAHLVGLNVTEMIAELALAKTLGATSESIIETIHPHPTMSEAVLEAAEMSDNKCIHI